MEDTEKIKDLPGEAKPTVMLGVSTYKKNEALINTLNQAIAGEIGPIDVFHIADAAGGFAEEVYKEYLNKELPFKLYYDTEEESQIWNSKNISIQFYLEQAQTTYLCMADDDNAYTKYPFINWGKPTLIEALIEAYEKTRYAHLLCFLDSYKDPLSNKAFFNTFPIHSANEYILRCGGTQGVFMFYTKLAIETVGYFDKLPERYGAEHSLHSARINRLCGRCPQDYAFLKHSYRYISELGCPNNYEVSQKEIDKNMKYYEKRMEDIYRGIDLTLKQRPRR